VAKADLRTLAKNMRARAKAVDQFASDVAVAGTKAMMTELVEVTPVDTSTALSNWQVNLGNPAADALGAAAPGHKGSTRSVSADKTLADAAAELQYKKPGQPIFVSNLINYIADLDTGSSTQFPGGFIPRALIVFRLAVREAAARLMR